MRQMRVPVNDDWRCVFGSLRCGVLRPENPVWDIFGTLAEGSWLNGVDPSLPDAQMPKLTLARILLPFPNEMQHDDFTAMLKKRWEQFEALVGQDTWDGAQGAKLPLIFPWSEAREARVRSQLTGGGAKM